MPNTMQMRSDPSGREGRELSEFYLTILQEFPALVWRSDPFGSCDWFNTTWLEFTGRRFEDEVGEGWTAGVHPEDLESCLRVWTGSFASRAPFEMEYRLRCHDGVYRWIRDFGRPLDGPNGEFLGYIGACYDITDLRQMAEDLAHLASHDPLTGLANRHAFEDAAALANSAARRGFPATVLFADLDRFKQANDRFGHEYGDRVLKEIAAALRAAVRDIDLVARIGGDEFGILLRGQEPDAVAEVEGRLREAVEHTGRQHGLDISLSTGSAIMDGGRSASQVLAEADDRMYQAKRQRRER